MSTKQTGVERDAPRIPNDSGSDGNTCFACCCVSQWVRLGCRGRQAGSYCAVISPAAAAAAASAAAAALYVYGAAPASVQLLMLRCEQPLPMVATPATMTLLLLLLLKREGGYASASRDIFSGRVG